MNANRAGACLLLVLVLPLWNLGVTKWQHAHNPVPGNFYSVDGRQMHLHCSGAGLPSIVIEPGASADWLGWQGVQPKLSHLTRVCTYDRAGHGWSQPRAGPRDAGPVWAQEQEELKTLSPLSWRVIARGSGHGIQHDRLDVVVTEMTRVIDHLRGGSAPPFGNTAIE